FSLKAKAGRFLFLLRTIFSIPKGSVVVFISPVYARMTSLLITALRKRGNIELICFIADINGLKDSDENLLKEEIHFFRQFEYFIAHNDAMEEWILQNVSADAVIAKVEFFDFFTKPVIGRRQISYDIAFAGNLEKSLFLENLHVLDNNPPLHFHLYGP